MPDRFPRQVSLHRRGFSHHKLRGRLAGLVSPTDSLCGVPEISYITPFGLSVAHTVREVEGLQPVLRLRCTRLSTNDFYLFILFLEQDTSGANCARPGSASMPP